MEAKASEGVSASRTRVRRWLRHPFAAPVASIVVLMASMVPMAFGTAAGAVTPDLSVIVREAAPDTDAAEAAVVELGGSVERSLDLIGGFSATIPSDAYVALVQHPSTVAVTPDGSLELQAAKLDPLAANDGTATPAEVVRALGIDGYWRRGFSGAGVDVALIDSGVAAVNGLTYPGKVINGPDISFESQDPERMYIDNFGHGTHMAGIIAGRDDGVPLPTSANDATSDYYGVAPGARIVSVKVAGADGIVDVSQVIAAIDWVVQHRNDNGLNIRVLNLSFGTDSAQAYQLDPLSFAVEQAWRRGIVVVVASGNDGNATPLRNPATNPYVVAVGALDTNGTNRRSDDSVLPFSNCGTTSRHVDLVAPGKSIVGLANPTSTAGVQNPEAMLGTRFIKGSGTSQAAAVISGVAALIIEQRPGATPDQVKALIMDGSQSMWGVSEECQGSGVPDMGKMISAPTPESSQNWDASTGLGSLHQARGSFIVTLDGVELTGEQDIMGNTWDAATWSGLSWSGLSWTGGTWNGATWTGLSWTGLSWTGLSWSGASWSGLSWSGLSWSGLSWTGLSWSGLSWTGEAWSDSTWSASFWR